MNNKKGMILLSLGSLVCLTVGFVLGQVVQAVTAMPGSADDPLVSQSYVEKIVGERTAAIQTQLDELKANANKGGSNTTTPNNGGNTTTPNNGGNTTTSNNNGNTTTTTNKTVTINAESLNVRGGAGTTYAKVGSVKKGEKYTLLETKSGTDGSWYKIKLSDGKEGWVSSQYAKVN
ncbi:MAG: SH3 domain-containing protein [Peptococcaceae bacterium]|jgi:uncharacterized protein YgiM (DUF1202 family)|nr:SH3 domain-containing protein [Peptococcaceae bacterium]